MIDTDKPLLTPQQRAKLAAVKQSLKDGENPYKTETVKRVIAVPRIEDDSLYLTKKQQKWLSSNKTPKTAGKWVVELIDGVETPVINKVKGSPAVKDGLSCIVCDSELEVVTAIYGKINLGLLKRTIEEYDEFNRLIEIKSVHFPHWVTGYSCQSCVDKLYKIKYHDEHGNLCHGITLLDRPVVKMTETFRKNHRTISHSVTEARVMNCQDDHLPRGREEVVLVTEHNTRSKDGFDEGWVVTLPKIKPEPVHLGGYARFAKTGRKVG